MYITLNERAIFAKKILTLKCKNKIDVKYSLDAFSKGQNNVCAKLLSSVLKIKSAEMSINTKIYLRHTVDLF